MIDIIEVELPSDVPDAVALELADEFRSMSVVEDAGGEEERSIEAAAILIWVKLVGSVVDVAGNTVGVLQKIIDTIRQKPVDPKKVKIKFKDGSSLSVDEISPEVLLKMVTKMTQQ